VSVRKNLDVPGRARFDFGRAEEENEIGLVTGLAWTEVGGDLLQIEARWCRARAS
jgi:ATP-dependent Lon protease